MSERRLAALGLLLLPFLAPPLAQADQTIRVAIAQNAATITLSAPSGLVVKAPHDDVVTNGRITVTSDASGLIVDGRPLRSDRVDVRGRAGAITVNSLTVSGRVTVTRQNGTVTAINELPLED